MFFLIPDICEKKFRKWSIFAIPIVKMKSTAGDHRYCRVRYFRVLFYLTALLQIITAQGEISGDFFSNAFRRINAGTKSDIRTLKYDRDGQIYFLAEDISLFHDHAWKKMNFSIDGNVYTFLPVSSSDIWFSVNLITNVSALYHYHNGITERLRSPFSNHISAILLLPGGRIFFTSYADVALLKGNTFLRFPPAPVKHVIEKVYSDSGEDFWALTNAGELVRYQHGNYNNFLPLTRIRDFAFSRMDYGYVMGDSCLFSLDAKGFGIACSDTRMKGVKSILLMKDGSVLMAGESGLLMEFSSGELKQYPPVCRENITGMLATKSGSIWLFGSNGLLMYNGPEDYPADPENLSGFSSGKMTSYGVPTDNEYGVAIQDFNGDGWKDIYSVRISDQNRLYMNYMNSVEKGTVFSEFREEAFKRDATGEIYPKKHDASRDLKLGVCAADFDNDGDQDLYLTSLNGINRFLVNNGNGYFRNVSEQQNRASVFLNRSNAASAADVDLDGDLDLFITCEEGTNRLFENDGTGHFRDITLQAGLESGWGGMCASFADVDLDGYPDLAVSFWNHRNKLYLNTSAGGRIQFRDFTPQTGINNAAPAKSNAVVFGDVNNDGFTDLFFANRGSQNKLYLNDGNGVFLDKTPEYLPPGEYLTNGAVFADFDMDGYQDLYITCVGRNILYRNLEGKRFSEATSAFGAEMSGYCTGCATGDVDNDGDPDLYVANYIQGDSKLFINNAESKHFLKIALTGVSSNRDAIGAKVWVYNTSQERNPGILAGFGEVGGGGGYASCSSKELIFAVDKEMTYTVLVKFPSETDTLTFSPIGADSVLNVREISGARATVMQCTGFISRSFMNEETLPEIIKYVIVLILIFVYNIMSFSGIRIVNFLRISVSCLVIVCFAIINSFFLYKWPYFSFFISPVVSFMMMALLHLFIERSVIRKLAMREKRELREKLSRDLHDDLASTLGSISIYADTLKKKTTSSRDDLGYLSGKIVDLTQKAMQSITDIIWMAAPKNDSLRSLASKISYYITELLADNNIGVRTGISIPEEPVILDEKTRNNTFLILKEGLMNIVRHSGASNVDFMISTEKNRCHICLRDDGKGFELNINPSDPSRGNGLQNMKKRAEEAGIQLQIKSEIPGGTTILMNFAI